MCRAVFIAPWTWAGVGALRRVRSTARARWDSTPRRSSRSSFRSPMCGRRERSGGGARLRSPPPLPAPADSLPRATFSARGLRRRAPLRPDCRARRVSFPASARAAFRRAAQRGVTRVMRHKGWFYNCIGTTEHKYHIRKWIFFIRKISNVSGFFCSCNFLY